MPNLTVPLDTQVYIIEKAREFDAEVPPVLTDDGSNPIDDEAGDTSILVEKLGKIGLDVTADPPDVFATIIRTDTAKWAKVIKEAGIKASE